MYQKEACADFSYVWPLDVILEDGIILLSHALGEFLFNIVIVLVLSFNLGPRRLNCLN